MFASTTATALFLLVNCAARAQSDPAGALCTADPEVSLAMHPAVSANINLLQVGLSMQEEDSVLEGELAKYKQFGPKATNEINDEFLGSLSENKRDFDRKSPEGVSLVTAASLLTAADSILTAVSKEKHTISAPAMLQVSVPAQGDGHEAGEAQATLTGMLAQAPPQAGMLCAVVGIVLLLACLLPWSGCLKLTKPKDEAVGFVSQARPVNKNTTDEVTMHKTSTDVWERQQHRKTPGRNAQQLLGMFREIDEIEQSDESPLGYFTRGDLAKAMSDPRVNNEMTRLGLSMDTCEAVFMQLDTEGDRLVDMGEFVKRCSSWAHAHTEPASPELM